MPPDGIVGRLQEAVEQRTGRTMVATDRIERLEEAARDGFALRRELDLIGWSVLDYLSGQPQEVSFNERRKMAQQARVVWASDPQAGAAVDLSNDFVFGRGVSKPKARDEAVQEVIDEAWDDPDNQLVLTSYEAQVALNTDLELQSNLFLVMFDDGDDGKVKLGLLNHDEVENVVRDPDNRLRILYYVARSIRMEWDFENDRPALPKDDRGQTQGDVFGVRRNVRYYEHWRNVAQAEEEGRRVATPPKQKMGEGRVRHIAINRTSEMAFGVPRFKRTIRWYTAYNDFMKARVDMAQAAAAFIMRSTQKSTPQQLAKLASRAVSRSGDPGPVDVEGRMPGPGTGAAILRENDAIKHENLSLNSGSGQALTDGQMIRSQISAATHFPQHYLGDAGSANLATATSMELPVLKHIESRQEVYEGTFRWFIDRVIEKAVEDGRLDRFLPEEEQALDGELVPPDGAPPLGAPRGPFAGQLPPPQPPEPMQQSYEDQPDDEAQTERDLGYEFSMPNPLRRTMTDLVSAVANIARTFDPNNSNPELSRILLGVVLGEGLELDDAAGAVERIFPEGYVDPAIAAAQAQAQAQQMASQVPPGFPGADGDQHQQGNPYGAPMQSQPPEQVMQQAAADFDRQFDAFPVPSRWIEFANDLPSGDPMRMVIEARFRDLPEVLQLRGRGRMTDVERRFREDVGVVIDEALAGLVASTNGNGNGNGKH